MTPLFLLLLFLACAPFLVFGSGNFISPPEDTGGKPSTYPVYKVGDVLSISWTSDYSRVALIINQNMSSLTELDYLPDPNSSNLTTSTYSWKIAIDGSDGNPKFDLQFNNNFNFMLFGDGSTSVFATSTYFNITDSTVDQYGDLIPSSTSSTAISHSTSSSSTSTPTGALSSTTSSIPQSNSAAKSTGLSSSAKIGLGVGLGVGAVAVIGIFALRYLLRRNRQQTGSVSTKEEYDHYAQDKYARQNMLPASELHGEAAEAHQSELDGTTAQTYQSELDGTAVQGAHLIELP